MPERGFLTDGLLLAAGIFFAVLLDPDDFFAVAAPLEAVLAGALRRRIVGTGDSPAWSPAQVTEMLKDLEQREKASRPPTSATPPPPPAGSYGYAPVFYPGSPSPELAVPIRLRPSEEKNGIDFSVQLTRMKAERDQVSEVVKRIHAREGKR